MPAFLLEKCLHVGLLGIEKILFSITRKRQTFSQSGYTIVRSHHPRMGILIVLHLCFLLEFGD